MGEQGFTLSCDAFRYGQNIPNTFTCDGANQTPKLRWMHAPEGTKSFALIVDDPDAPDGTFTHWVQFNIPGSASELPDDRLGMSGKNDFQQDGYGGPCPPPNHGEHRYFFRLFALDTESLDIGPGAKREELEKAIDGHVLEQAEIMGRYERKPSS